MSNPRAGRAPRESSPCVRRRRDAALERTRSITRTIAITSVAAVAAFGLYISPALPGHAAPPRVVRLDGQPVRWERLERGQLAQPVTGQPRPSELATATVAAECTGGQRIELTVGTATAGRARQLAVHRTTRWSTTVELVVTDPRAVARATVILQRQLDRVEQVASRFRPDSEIARCTMPWPSRPAGPIPVSDDLSRR